MPKTTLYPGVNNSPQTVTTAEISASAQAVPVDNPSVFPAGPNLATLGTGDDAEVIQYASISGGELIGCVRGFGGTTAKIWPADTVAYRAFTLEDYRRLCANIDALFAEKLGATGDLSAATAAFTAAGVRENLASGESMAVLLGKLARWYADLKAVAWSGSYADLANLPESFAPARHAAAHAAGGGDALTPAAIGAQPAIAAAGLLKGDGEGGVTAAQPGSDYQTPIMATGLLKGAGSGGVQAAQPGTDYLASESDPTVPAWAKAPQKPAYTPAEIGAQPNIEVTGLLKGDGGTVQAAVAGEDYARPSTALTGTLLASAWAEGAQTVAFAELAADANGVLGPGDALTDEQAQALLSAGLVKTAQAAGSVTIKAFGTVPTVDLPIQIVIVG